MHRTVIFIKILPIGMIQFTIGVNILMPRVKARVEEDSIIPASMWNSKVYLLLAKAIKAVSIICMIRKVFCYTKKSKLLTVAASAVGV